MVPPPGSPPCFHCPTPSLLIQLLQPLLDSAEKTHSGAPECDALRDWYWAQIPTLPLACGLGQLIWPFCGSVYSSVNWGRWLYTQPISGLAWGLDDLEQKLIRRGTKGKMQTVYTILLLIQRNHLIVFWSFEIVKFDCGLSIRYRENYEIVTNCIGMKTGIFFKLSVF